MSRSKNSLKEPTVVLHKSRPVPSPMPSDPCSQCKGERWVQHTDERHISARMVCPTCLGSGIKKSNAPASNILT